MNALIDNKMEVLEIKESILNTNPDLEVVEIDGFTEGDELNYYIVINKLSEATEDEPIRKVTSYSAIKQSAIIQRLRLENDRLHLENIELKKAVAELAEAQEKDNTNMQLALSELAEMIAGGE